MLSNSKGLSPVTILFWSIMFIIIYSMALAPIIEAQGQLAIINGGYTGIEALFYDNLHLFVGFLFFLFIVAVGSVVSD